MKNNKSLGQHWLYDRAVLNEIADLAARDLEAQTCLEIGPGLGTLTAALLRRFEGVVAVEFDANLAKNLPKSFPGKNLKVVNADFLKFDLEKMLENYVVAGNIPYYITSPIVERILCAEKMPKRAVLLMQKEVAERIAAVKGRQSLLSLLVQNRAEVELGPVVLRGLFTPPPKVDSQVIVLTPRAQPLVEEKVLNFAKLGFRMPRKKLAANLAGHMGKNREQIIQALKMAGIDENARAENLDLKDFENLLKNI